MDTTENKSFYATPQAFTSKYETKAVLLSWIFIFLPFSGPILSIFLFIYFVLHLNHELPRFRPHFPVVNGIELRWFEKQFSQLYLKEWTLKVNVSSHTFWKLKVKNCLWSFSESCLHSISDTCTGQVKWFLHNIGPCYCHHWGEMHLHMQLSHLLLGWRFFLWSHFHLFFFWRRLVLGEMHSCSYFYIAERCISGLFFSSLLVYIVFFYRFLWSVWITL